VWPFPGALPRAVLSRPFRAKKSSQYAQHQNLRFGLVFRSAQAKYQPEAQAREEFAENPSLALRVSVGRACAPMQSGREAL